ncbi:CrpP-related protein [Achromobacter spanius]|uniref:CrpP-related protein n=1 Tax=Achromobacter spanius TaxID=217203 RepID=UPI00312CA2D3
MASATTKAGGCSGSANDPPDTSTLVLQHYCERHSKWAILALPITILLEEMAMHRDDIQKLGAQAAREGLSLLDCPFLRTSEMPGHCGGSIAEWREKVEAWEAGWRKEVRSRPSAVRSRAHRLVTQHRSPPIVLGAS